MLTTLRKIGFTSGLLLGFGLLALPVRAEDPAHEVVGLFVQSCLRHVEDPNDLQAWIAATPQLQKLPQQQADGFLLGKRGDAWSASNDTGQFVLIVFSDDTCTVMAQMASADQVSLLFSEYVRRKNLPLDKVADRKDFVRGIDKREETYRSSSGSLLYEVVLLTSKSLRAEVQAVLTTRPNR